MITQELVVTQFHNYIINTLDIRPIFVVSCLINENPSSDFIQNLFAGTMIDVK
jgi:hypothetical protein